MICCIFPSIVGGVSSASLWSRLQYLSTVSGEAI
jgi:hypothetical protein